MGSRNITETAGGTSNRLYKQTLIAKNDIDILTQILRLNIFGKDD